MKTPPPPPKGALSEAINQIIEDRFSRLRFTCLIIRHHLLKIGWNESHMGGTSVNLRNLVRRGILNQTRGDDGKPVYQVAKKGK